MDLPPTNDFCADPTVALRQRMVKQQIIARGVNDPAVLAALQQVPRHRFVPDSLQNLAYADQPLTIGYGQTISQPYIVAYMTEAAHLTPSSKVLEIGTGCGYQAAILAEIAQEVFTVEVVPELARQARDRLEALGYQNIHYKIGDGYQGWSEFAPYDAILVTAAPDHRPQPLLQQLAVGGHLVIPVGTVGQRLEVLHKTSTDLEMEKAIAVRFVPLQGHSYGF
ncbi:MULTISPECIES: protein-L-isoaspartate(D-aspartate) O-methyltransferase [Cyanophyceae]|uniref:Protein-L-isoaspartate O-methyltransferase n=1 Tax=Picosynechococcus sp. (strain ATCC 27264 / PCC 7002 / PR-6) TaxID=32049 RepID=PIMT_PICP2|nr:MULTISPECIES: protein-L-isoaspartate(D-aspartate) O-methyltransferase [Cyanophyceae]B1XQE1.1 RecName: Full=Protein-L-isoaspartate O-methyltransferase; AltName: Full=L-isoaspartyl protein carboxyl methyltransferase; AltName: Full=Protein L-isoaspartyl methyltransferase; AltName: Full=Protein-beta-aspartate methyltransferase; Short=PIMT [Picosynechococcus sp. PCC 7002]ACA98683.1 protein-L-isoaspartate O-methyltransferase [Picosynechococcus sp. PCC 7002]ANV89772.1 protein-L-isoaspartate O-methyl